MCTCVCHIHIYVYIHTHDMFIYVYIHTHDMFVYLAPAYITCIHPVAINPRVQKRPLAGNVAYMGFCLRKLQESEVLYGSLREGSATTQAFVNDVCRASACPQRLDSGPQDF